MSSESKIDWKRKVWRLLAPHERRSAGKLILLMIVAMGLETLGIGLFIPVLVVITQADFETSFPFIQPVLQKLGNPSHSAIITGMMLALIAIYAVKALFLGFVAWRQMKFAFGVREQLSQRLFKVYIRQPYAFLLRRNSSQLLRNITSEATEYTTYTIIPCLNILAESLVFAGLAILLLWVEPVGATVVGVLLCSFTWVFHKFIRVRVNRWGEMRQHHEGLRIQHIQQGFGSLKDVKVLGRESEFLEQFSVHNSQSTRMARQSETTAQMPRLGLEVLAVSGLSAIVLIVLAQGNKVETILPTMGLFAAASFRLLPSATRLLGSFQSLKYSAPVVDNLYTEFGLTIPESTESKSMPRRLEKKIEIKQVCFAYAGGDDQVLSNINFNINRGESIGLIGSSGAGKSTLADVLLGLLVPSSGKILVDGRDIHQDLRSWQDQIGYVPQSIFLTDDTLRRNVAFGLPESQINDRAVKRAIKAAQLEKFVNSLPDGLGTIVGERGVRLSGGQCQRIGLARALYHDPGVLVLDEATGALDKSTELEVMEAVRALKGVKTLIIITHRITTAQYCDRLFSIENGVATDKGIYRESSQPRTKKRLQRKTKRRSDE